MKYISNETGMSNYVSYEYLIKTHNFHLKPFSMKCHLQRNKPMHYGCSFDKENA
jgi:hypothetical protein